jgi:hypothetical protein
MPVEVGTVLAWWFWMNLITCVFGVYVAAEKNRSLVIWGVLCLIFGLVALVALAGIPVIEDEDVLERSARLDRIKQNAIAWTDPLGPPPGIGDD